MAAITTIGLDLAKNWFQVHGADTHGRPVLRKKLARAKLLEFFASLPPCLIGMEACGSAHHWARELGKLGHEVRLMPPQYVRPYLDFGGFRDRLPSGVGPERAPITVLSARPRARTRCLRRWTARPPRA
jgi:transposase